MRGERVEGAAAVWKVVWLGEEEEDWEMGMSNL